MARERSGLMRQVDADVAQIYGASIAYTPGRVSGWLRHWSETFDIEEPRDWWEATVTADVFAAVRTLPVSVRLFFQLYCLDGLDFDDLWDVARWSRGTCWRRFELLKRGVIEHLCDSTVHAQESRTDCHGALPRSYAYTCEGKFDTPDPVDPRRGG